MEYYSAIKRNKIGSFIVMWMDPDTVRVKNKEKYCILMHIYGI